MTPLRTSQFNSPNYCYDYNHIMFLDDDFRGRHV